MKIKNIWRISVATTLEAEDAVSEMLGTITGANASSYFDVEAATSLVSVFQPKPPPSSLRRQLASQLRLIRQCGLNTGPARVQIARVRREDWAESWKRHFKPLEIDHTLLIKPSWSRKRARSGQSVVILDPGLSFGTGQHPTTSFCLQELVRCRNFAIRQSFLDIGTGSGILAIAAVKLGYHPVDALDFDPDAVRIARANARVNRVLPRLNIRQADVTRLPQRPERQYDLLAANLISNLLLAEKKRLISRLKRTGTLVLAGILATEFDDIAAGFSSEGLKLVQAQTEKEWRSGSFQFS